MPVRRRLLGRLLLVLPLAIAAAGIAGSVACYRRPAPAPGEPAEPTTRLRVDNRNYLDHRIYVLRGAERVPLGTATALTTTTFRIPASLLFGGTVLRFMADPVGARGTPVSEEITVRAGDEVGLIIRP